MTPPDSLAVTLPAFIYLELAETVARHVHADDTDKLGEPYWVHLREVSKGAKRLGGGEVEVAAAWLHDSIEDHPESVSVPLLTEWGFPPEVGRIVDAMTHRPGVSYSDYIDVVVAAGKGAVIVKLADLRHNTRPDRLNRMRLAGMGETVDRLEVKYRPAIDRLELELESHNQPAGAEG